MKPALLALLLLLLPACPTIDKSVPHPADFPTLEPRIRYVGYIEMQRKCGIPLLASLFVQCLGLAEPDFCTKTCNVTLLSDAVREHELWHCKGYDHPGETHMKDLWAAYKQMDGPRFCSLRMGLPNYCRKWPEDREQCGGKAQYPNALVRVLRPRGRKNGWGPHVASFIVCV